MECGYGNRAHRVAAVSERKKLLDSISNRTAGTCVVCRLQFPQRGGFETRCPICFKLEKSYKLLTGDEALLWIQLRLEEKEKEVQELRKALAEKGEAEKSKPIEPPKPDLKLPVDIVKELIFLCHPDRHNNSDRATAVTQYLLSLREKRKK